jgi:hypothetical protein
MPGVDSTALLRNGCRIQDAYPVCAFFSGRARSSVLGIRPSASDRLRCRVPGPRCQVIGILAISILHLASCIMHHASCIHILPERSVTPSLRHSVTSSLGLSHERLSS